MDKYLIRIFDGFLDTVDENGFMIADFIDYVKERYPKKTPCKLTVAHLCCRSERCCYDEDQRCYLLTN